MNYFQVGGYLIIAALAGFFTWKILGWRDDSIKLAGVQAKLEQEQKANVKRVVVTKTLWKEKEKIVVQVKNVIKRVPIKSNCVIGADAIRVLNEARGVPVTSAGVIN